MGFVQGVYRTKIVAASTPSFHTELFAEIIALAMCANSNSNSGIGL